MPIYETSVKYMWTKNYIPTVRVVALCLGIDMLGNLQSHGLIRSLFSLCEADTVGLNDSILPSDKGLIDPFLFSLIS